MRTMTMAALVSVVPAAFAGQAEQAASAWRAQACEQALEKTAGAGAHDAEWRRSLAYLSACGRAGGAVLARELARLESSSDVDELTQSYRAISHIRDAQVFEAALELVGDASATPESRIVAFKVLITLHDPSRASLSISSFLPGSQPDFMRQDHHAVSDGELLPADWSQRTRTRIGEVVEDADESEPMRFAAGRALFYLLRQRGVSRPACESEGGCRDGPDRAHLRGVDRSGARGGYIPDPYRDRLPQPTAERGDGRAIDCIPRYNHGRLALSEAIRTRLHRGHDDIGIAADGATGVRSSVRPTPISASRWGPRASRVWWVANTR